MHFLKWKENVLYGQFKRIRKNCMEDNTFEEQAEIIEGQIRESESERKNIWEHSLRMPI